MFLWANGAPGPCCSPWFRWQIQSIRGRSRSQESRGQLHKAAVNRAMAGLPFGCLTCSWKKLCTIIKNGINQLSASAGFVLSTVAMENGPFIDGGPSKNCDFPWHVVILTIYHTSESSLVIKHRNGKSPIHRGFSGKVICKWWEFPMSRLITGL